MGRKVEKVNQREILHFFRMQNIILDTFYQQKDMHKYTTVQPSKGEKSIIDYKTEQKAEKQTNFR